MISRVLHSSRHVSVSVSIKNVCFEECCIPQDLKRAMKQWSRKCIVTNPFDVRRLV
jgi:hypothetical protein